REDAKERGWRRATGRLPFRIRLLHIHWRFEANSHTPREPWEPPLGAPGALGPFPVAPTALADHTSRSGLARSGLDRTRERSMAWEFQITEHVAKSPRHTTFYLSCGTADAPLMIFVHGWPELSISWRHQLPCFASLGFRAIAPDMRGYGRSSLYQRHEDYRL